MASLRTRICDLLNIEYIVRAIVDEARATLDRLK